MLAQSYGGNHTGAGLQAETDIGDAGVFLANAGDTLLHGFSVRLNEPGGWEKFKVDTSSNLTTYCIAYKPGGGSRSVLFDRSVKKSIEPINGALHQSL